MEKKRDVCLWQKKMGAYTPADWDSVSDLIDAMIQSAIAISNNSISIRMVREETRTGITQFSAGGSTSAPPCTGKQAAKLLAAIINTAQIPVDISKMSVADLYNTCIAFVKKGLRFQEICAMETAEYAKTQENKLYAIHGTNRANKLLADSTDVFNKLESIHGMLDFLVADRLRRKEQNQQRGKANPDELQQTLERIERNTIDAANKANTAADNTAALHIVTQAIESDIDLLVEEKRFDKDNVNITARYAIVDLWNKFKGKEHDDELRFPKAYKRTYKTFFECCGTLSLYEKPNGEIVSVNNAVPGITIWQKVEKLKALMHNESVKKNIRKKHPPK